MARVSNTFEMTSTEQFDLDDIENFAKMLRAAGASGGTKIIAKESYGDRPGELNTYTLRASVVPVEGSAKLGHKPGYRSSFAQQRDGDDGYGPREGFGAR